MIWRKVFDLASRRGGDARLSILIFHRVLPRQDELFPGEPHAKSFAALLGHITSRFRVLPLVHAVRALQAGTLPSRALSITFDDGYADNLTVAAPILRHYSVKATVFIATGFLDGGWMFNDLVIEAFRATRRKNVDLQHLGLAQYELGSIDERRRAIDDVLARIKYVPPQRRYADAEEVLRAADVTIPPSPMLTRDMVRSFDDSCLDIGAHTVSHPILTQLVAADAAREITQSKVELEQLAQRPIALFAYPNGTPGVDYCGDHVRMVREAGFEAAVSTAPGTATRETDCFQLPRFTPWSRHPLKFDMLMLRNLGQ